MRRQRRALFYPFSWDLPCLFAPLLAFQQLSLLKSPYPFFVGVPREFIELPTVVPTLQHCMVVDVDNMTVGLCRSHHD